MWENTMIRLLVLLHYWNHVEVDWDVHKWIPDTNVLLPFTFGRGQDIQHFKYLGYDRACGLQPFLQNITKKQVPFTAYLLEHVKFLMDRFHIKGHTEKCCMPLENNPACYYHPDLANFKEICTANTECAEQAFRWLNKVKYTVRQMSRYKFNFFLFELVNMHSWVKTQSRQKASLSLVDSATLKFVVCLNTIYSGVDCNAQ